MKHPSMQRINRTGVATNPQGAKAMREAAARVAPSSSGSAAAVGKVRIEYARDIDEGERGYGSVAMPPALAARLQAMLPGLTGDQRLLMVDKLGERFAFERTGVRLYEALVSKHEAFGGFTGGPSRAGLIDILNDEHEHFVMLEGVIRKLGGDPTAMTPSAVLAGTLATGVLTVVTDPRTTLVHGLEAILVAELADVEGWGVLIELARKAGNVELIGLFEDAERREEQHLGNIRRWLNAAQQRPVTG